MIYIVCKEMTFEKFFYISAVKSMKQKYAFKKGRNFLITLQNNLQNGRKVMRHFILIGIRIWVDTGMQRGSI